MAIPFSGIVTPSSVIFSSIEGKMISITDAHLNFETIKKTIKDLQAMLKIGRDDFAKKLHAKLSTLADISGTITKAAKGRVEVANGVVYFENEAVHGAITDRILWGIREGYDMKPYLLFLENLMSNPSKRAVDELYGFIENSAMGITDDGMIIAYKRVRENYRDCHSGTFDNSVGQVLTMPRNKVDDDSSRTCSYGYHFCSFSYLKHFGSSGRGDRIMIVKVNPADVVSIPADYNDAKARCCHYEVIGEYEGSDKDDILASRAVWAGNTEWAESLPTEDHEPSNWEASWQASYEDDWSESAEEEEETTPSPPPEPHTPPDPLFDPALAIKVALTAMDGQITEVFYHYTRDGSFLFADVHTSHTMLSATVDRVTRIIFHSHLAWLNGTIEQNKLTPKLLIKIDR